MSKFSPQKTSNKPAGVQWWQQYPRSFVTPYGPADNAPPPSKIFHRLQPFTCEWFTRPDVALSEYSHTITSNIPLLQKHGKKVLDKSYVTNLMSDFQPIWDSLNALNKTNAETTPTIADAKQVLRSMLDNDELDQKMEKMFLVSGAMFALSTNYLVSTALLRHPKEFSKKVTGENNRTAASFRKLGDVQGMKNYVLHPFKDDITTENPSRKASRSVTKAFGDSPSQSQSESQSESQSDDKHESCTTKKTRRRHGKEKTRTRHKRTTSKQPVTISSSESEDERVDQEEVPSKTLSKSSKKKDKKSNKRKSLEKLVEELESEVQNPTSKRSKK